MTSRSPSIRRRPGRPRSPEADEAILVSAMDLLHTVGYAALTMEAVAEHAGVGKTTVYRRFPSKQALIQAAALKERDTTAVIPDTGSVRQDLTILIRNSFAILSQTAWGQVIAAVATEAAGDEDIARTRREFWRARFDALAEIVKRGIARGEVRREVDPQLICELALGPGYVRYLVTGAPLPLELAEEIVEEVMKGAANS